MLAVSYPLPNLVGAANNYVNSGSTPGSANSINTRVDHNFSEKSRLTGRYTHRHTLTQAVMSYPGPAGGRGRQYHLTTTPFTT